MIDLNQKIKEFARKAYELDALAEYGEWTPNLVSEELLKSMHGVFIQFARLVAEDCAMIAYQTSDIEALAALKTQRDELLEALHLALEYWAHREQRYKNRSPVWVQKSREAIAKAGGAA